METREIINQPEIQALHTQFLQQGIPFQDKLQEALNKAVAKHTDNPQVAIIVNQVVAYLEAQLIQCIAEKAGSWLTNFFNNRIVPLFKRNK